MQERASSESDEHGREYENYHGNDQFRPKLVSSFLQVSHAVAPEFLSDGTEGVAQRRAVLKALVDHGAEPAQSIRSGSAGQIAEGLPAIGQHAHIVEQPVEHLA